MYIRDYSIEHNAASYSQELTVRFVLDKDDKLDPQTLMSKRVTIIPSEGVVKQDITMNINDCVKVKASDFNEQVMNNMMKRAEEQEYYRKKAAAEREASQKYVELAKQAEAKALEESKVAIQGVKGINVSDFQREYDRCAKMAGIGPYDGGYPQMKNTWGPSWDIDPRTFAQKYTVMNDGRENKMNERNMTPHSELFNPARNDERISINGNRLTGTMSLTDETATVTVNLPGIDPDRVSVRRIENMLRIRVAPLKSETVDVYGFETTSPVKELHIIMTTEEQVTDVTIALGVLEISIDRGREVEDFEVNAAD